MLEVISKLRAVGKTILIATHVPDHAFLLATKVAIMQRKGILAYGPPDIVIREEMMSIGIWYFDLSCVMWEGGIGRSAFLCTHWSMRNENDSKSTSHETPIDHHPPSILIQKRSYLTT